MKKHLLSILGVLALISSACSTSQPEDDTPERTPSQVFNAYLDSVFYVYVDRSPEYQTYLGIKKDYSKWDEISPEAALEEYELKKDVLDEVRMFDKEVLDRQAAISYDLFVEQLEKDLESYEKFRLHNYPVNQMFGKHSSVPAFLINFHSISNYKEAEDYISRLNGIAPLFDQLILNLQEREEAGIVLPKFLFPFVLDDSRNILKGYPIVQNSQDRNTLYDDFTEKVAKLSVSRDSADVLELGAQEALIGSVAPAYKKLITFLEGQQKRANDNAGIWKWPNGDEYYEFALANTTTTNMTPEQIYTTGLSELERIHKEMDGIRKKVGFKKNLQGFFEYMRTSSDFYNSNDAAGRKKYLDTTQYYIDDMKARLPELFTIFPKAKLIVKPVEPFREKSAGIAFYNQPALDGSRPGTYYVNLSNMKAMPVNEIEALAYHEAIPGHHMQIAIAQELEGLPMFRKFGRYTAYTEGWGLYSELIPKELGLYQNPYSDFGRLSMEAFRAARLVADVGLHDKKWTRKQAIDFYMENTPSSYEECRKMVDRHCVMPSQATAYKIGMLKILELREKAKTALGDQFDIRDFHDTVLKFGPLPLTILEDAVDDYIANTKSA